MNYRPTPIATRMWPAVVVAMVGVAPLVTAQGATPAGGQVKLSAVIAAFLADSGVRTRGLAWSTGGELPIEWSSPRPVPNREAFTLKRGITHVRDGKFIGTLADSVALGMTIRVSGTGAGVSGMSVRMDSLFVINPGGGGFLVNRELIERLLVNDGLTFQPLKCKRETEGASFGNLVDAVRVPGKSASGLWWAWQSPQQRPTVTLTLLYRRADMNQVECRAP